MKNDPLNKLVRPVSCWFCNKPMFYNNHKRWKPEVAVEVRHFTGRHTHFTETIYAHAACWDDHFDEL